MVGGEMAVVRLIAHVARRRNGNRSDYFSVVGGVFVKVDHRKKVRSHAGLVAGPDVESLRRLVPVVIRRVPGFHILGLCRKCGDKY